MTRFATLVLVLFLAGCAGNATPDDAPAPVVRSSAPLPDPFGDYWYQGEAELTSYALDQARYGELHDGEAVLIFVTEDLSRSRQVKTDFADRSDPDRVTVMKLNATKKFITGIYPYSMMTSVFTPIERDRHPHTLKVTTSSQEWCGHTFTQINHNRGGYDVQLYSYFEDEGDQSLRLDGVVLEDELWTLIRLNPALLPEGDIEVVPGSMAQRLSHEEWQVRRARASIAPAGDSLMAFSLHYPDLNRTLTIQYRADFPFEIEGWEETVRSGFGAEARELTTRATRKKRIMLDYWSRNGTEDEALRQQLE